MPLMDRRSNLTPANARNSDVASKMVEHVSSMQQQKMQAAFRVQGIQGILYNRLTQGRACSCNSKNPTVERLNPDGKASTGAINRVLTGTSNFGVSSYNASPEDDFNSFGTDPPAPNNQFNEWLGSLNIVGPEDGGTNQIENEATVGDNGQYSPDFDELFAGIDMSHLGISDISCPICFGSGYVGGYSAFRGHRHVIVPSEMTTDSYYDLPTFELSPGTHTVTVVFPRGALGVDVFRAMLNDKPVAAEFFIDNENMVGKNPLRWCDGRPHQLQIRTTSPITHFEMQFALSNTPVYFEIPKLTRTADISFLEQQEPFQILVSPEVPLLQSMDIITESQLGKVLIVSTVNPWNTRGRNMLGHECQVRVAQPQELWRIMPFRKPLTSQKASDMAHPSRSAPTSGFRGIKF